MTVHCLGLCPVLDRFHGTAYAGGGAVNTWKALRRLGVDTELYVLLGGASGEALERLLGAQVHTERTHAPTRTNMLEKHGSEASNDTPTYEPTPTSRLLNTLESNLAAGDYLVLTGKLPRGMQTTFYAERILDCHTGDVRSVLDTGTPAVARPALAEKPYIAKMTHAEWNAVVTPKEFSHLQGIEYIITTQEQEAYMFSPTCTVATAPSVEVKCATAAGDSFTAGLIYGLLKGYTPEETLRYATACGTATVTRPGAHVFGTDDIPPILAKTNINNLLLLAN